MAMLEFFFLNVDEDRCVPHIRGQETVEYTYDDTGGSICFDGYFYIEDHAPPYPEDDVLPKWNRPRRHTAWLPKILYMSVKRTTILPSIDTVRDGYIREQCSKVVDETWYTIEVYKRVIHASTDKYRAVEGVDGESANVCFFPTDRQTIYFRVLDIMEPNHL